MLKVKLFSTLIFTFLFVLPSFSQIETGKIVPKSEQNQSTPKKKRVKKPKDPNRELGTSLLSFGGGPYFSQPINRMTNNLYSKPLGNIANEKGKFVPSFGMNYKVLMKKNFYFNLGIDYSQSGEKFSWKSTETDSAYSYKNKYQLISIPIGVNYFFGKKIQLISGLGIAPQLVFGSKNYLSITNSQNAETKTTTQLRDRMNDFNILGYAQLGVQFQLARGVYFYLLPEFRYSFFNTLNKQAHYSRKFWQLGVQIGFAFNI